MASYPDNIKAWTDKQDLTDDVFASDINGAYHEIIAVETSLGTPNNSYIRRPGYGEDSGSTDAYAITVSPAITAYVTGQTFIVKCNTANTGAATLNVCSVGAVAIKKLTSTGLADLGTGDIPTGGTISVIYNGTCFVALGLGLGSHLIDTVAHGVSGAVVGTTNTQTMTNKTLTSPTINTPTISTPDITGSMVQGSGCIASGKVSSAIGWYNTASGDYSHAQGSNNIASGDYSHAGGRNGEASGQYSFSSGLHAIASGEFSHAAGLHVDTNLVSNAIVVGAFGAAITENAWHLAGGASDGLHDDISVKIATTTYGSSAVGAGYANSWNTSGADYAEMFEWADGNPSVEDRVGRFVTFDSVSPEKIRLANGTDTYILGVVSGTAGIVGDNYELGWQGKALHDDFGRVIRTWVEQEAVYDEEGELAVPEFHGYVTAPNPDYDSTQTYIPREQRPEWDTVGMLGKIFVRDDGTCQVGGYCKPNANGEATAASTGYYVMQRVNDNVIRIIFK